MNILSIFLAICTDTGTEMPYSSSNFNNFCGCIDKPDDDDKLNCSIVQLQQSQSSKLCVSLQYAMLCTTPLRSSSSCASTDDIFDVSTDDVSGDVSGDSTGDVSGDSTDDASSSCVSLQNAILCTNPLSCSSSCVSHKAAILRTGRILAKPCRMRWKLLSGKF